VSHRAGARQEQGTTDGVNHFFQVSFLRDVETVSVNVDIQSFASPFSRDEEGLRASRGPLHCPPRPLSSNQSSLLLKLSTLLELVVLQGYGTISAAV
jgi:hypothetical protein